MQKVQKGNNNLGKLLRPETRPPRLDAVQNSRSQGRRPQQIPEDSNRPSALSSRSDQVVDDTESGALSSQLRSNQTYSKPQLPRLNMNNTAGSLQREIANANTANQQNRLMPLMPSNVGVRRGGGIKLPMPMSFPHSTKNQMSKDSTSTSKFNFGSGKLIAGNGQGTPSSRAIMHAHTNITSRDNYIDTNNDQEDASLQVGVLPTGYTGRTFQSSGILMSPAGGGSQRQSINIALGKNVDDDEPEPDEQSLIVDTLEDQPDSGKKQQRELEEIRSVSTLYGGGINSRAPKPPKQQIMTSEVKKRTEVTNNNKLQLKIDELSDNFTNNQKQESDKSGSAAKSSFANFFSNQNTQKQAEIQADNESRSQLGPGERPWYYFEGNTTESKLASDSQKDQIIASQSTTGEKEGLVDLYSNSNILTPILPENAGLQQDKNQAEQNENEGRMTLHSVHLSSTEHMKDSEIRDADMAFVHHNKTKNEAMIQVKQELEQDNGFIPPLQELSLSPPLRGQRKQKILGQQNHQIKSEQFAKVTSANDTLTKLDHQNSLNLVDVQLPLDSNRKNRKYGVSASHQDNLFVTTEKKRISASPTGAQQKLLHLMPTEQEQWEPTEVGHVLNPSIDFKIRSNNEAIAGNSQSKLDQFIKPIISNTAKDQNNNILTPSFISSEMQVNRTRRSDLLLNKKEPSVQANGRKSMDGAALAGEVAAEIAVSGLNNLNYSMCSSQGAGAFTGFNNEGSALRESRFSQQAAAVVSQILRNSIGRERPVIYNAGTPAVMQPNMRDSDSSLMLAGSSKFSQHNINTLQSVKADIGASQEMTEGRRSKTTYQRRQRLASDQSGVRQTNSSYSRKSIRRSTISDAQEVTGFAIYVKNFFSNLFGGCCQTGGNIDTTGNDQNQRSSVISSMGNIHGYTFVPVPNTNSNSTYSNQTKTKNGSVVRRSQLIKDFKGVAERREAGHNKEGSILDTEKDIVEVGIDREDVVLNAVSASNAAANLRQSNLTVEDGESDIIDDDSDHEATAQRPLQAARFDYLTPGNRIEQISHRAVENITISNQQTSSREQTSSQQNSGSGQRITAGTVEIATQRTSDSQNDEFIFQKVEPLKPQGNTNPFQVRPLRQYLANSTEDEGEASDNSDENYKTMGSSASPSKGLPQFHNTNQPVALMDDRRHHSNYEVPNSLSLPINEQPSIDEADSLVTAQQLNNEDEEEENFERISLPIGAIMADSQNLTQQQPEVEAKKKNRLKDMITQVPQSTGQQQQSRSAKHTYEDNGHPSITPENQREAHSADEGDSNGSDYEEGEEEGYQEGDETPDVQKIHFNQTVQALFNIRATGLTMPPFEQMKHLLVNLPEPNHPRKTKTVVFDLDETLIHCVDDVETENPDVIIPIQFSEEPEPVLAGINIRPFARECLEAANQHFQVVVFTASEQEYADPIIDYLDPDGTLIQARYFRPSCVRTRNPDFYIKDMRIFHQRSLSDIILVDNSVYSFAFQLDNGVPIVSFYQDPKDEEMLHLKFYLDCLKDCDDVREKNKEAFQLVQLAETQLQRIIEEQHREQQIQTYSEDSLSPYEHNYRLPEQAQYGDGSGGYSNPNNGTSFNEMEEHEADQEEDDEEEFERDPRNANLSELQDRFPASTYNDLNAVGRHSNIMEECEEEESSFECTL